MDTEDDNLTLSNTTLNYNNWSPNDYYNRYNKITQKTVITLYSIVFALGIIGNGLVIWIAGFRMKKTISAVWFLNLAIADFLCCASLPLRIANWDIFFISFAYCVLNMFLFNLNMSASVLLLTAMSIDRWVSVMWPFWAKVHRTCKLVRITAAIIWGLSLIVACLVFYVYGMYVGGIDEWCFFPLLINYYSFKLYQPIQLIRLVIMFVFPFLIIFTSYVTIFYKLRKGKRSQRSSRIITSVILCFFICWFPYYIWPLTARDKLHDFQYYTVHTVAIILACLNSCINPIIYVFMAPDFQQGFFRSIPSRLERVFGDHPNDLCREREDTGNTRSTSL
ncbi:C3a anaphylatoxin chemotactic receptor-like [Ranitomeya variabilis]|uniref:C3a anaphylatoxin chemotactic receptor-like n=1 Tax=Ranitomeya variabilis TaxID=490064 RepID=UPI004056746A